MKTKRKKQKVSYILYYLLMFPLSEASIWEHSLAYFGFILLLLIMNDGLSKSGFLLLVITYNGLGECSDVAGTKAYSSLSVDHLHEKGILFKDWSCKHLQQVSFSGWEIKCKMYMWNLMLFMLRVQIPEYLLSSIT